MYKLKTTYITFDKKQQKNTFYYYNFLFIKYLKNKFDWVENMSTEDYDNTNKLLNEIKIDTSKEDIRSYHVIYNKFLSKYNIFHKNKTFIDCGSAPGGFLKFATENKMIGYGITLPSKNDNMALKMKYNYDIIYGDLLNENFLLNLKNKIKDKVDFINIGAVFYDKIQKKDDTILQNQLFINQFYIVKEFLKDGGSFMFVYDVYFTFYNFISLMHLFTKLDCEIEFIPVQPNFMTSQIYILVKNINKFSNELFDKLYCIITRKYFPIIKNDKYFNDIFGSNKINIESLKTTYYLKVISNCKIKNNIIYSQLLPKLNLDIINKLNYNLYFLKYEDSAYYLQNSKLYNKQTLKITYNIYNKIKKIRNTFIEKNNDIVNIESTYEMYIKINNIVKKIDNLFYR